MNNIIREYRTTPISIDLSGAHPCSDWKGDKRLGQCLQMLLDADIDWQAQPEKRLEELKNLPEGTRVTRLYYKVFIYTSSLFSSEFADFDHCDFPNALTRQMADCDNTDTPAMGLFIQTCASFIYPNGNENDCYVMNGNTFMLNNYLAGHPSYAGSPHIALLLLMTKEKQEWNDPTNFDLSDGHPLNLSEQASLFDRSHICTQLTISLGRNYQKPTSQYCHIDAKDFPQKLIDRLAEDDAKNLLDNVTSIEIDATIKTAERTFQRTYTFSLPADYPPKWDVCKVDFDWQADHNMYGESKCYARPGTFAAFKYPNIYSLHPIRIDDMPVPSEGARLFGIPKIIWYDDNSMTIRYDERNITLRPEEPFKASKGLDYTTFTLTIRLEIDD